MKSVASRITALLCVGSLLTPTFSQIALAQAQQKSPAKDAPAASVKYPIGVGDVVSSISSALAAHQATATVARSTRRLETIRAALTTLILEGKEPGAIRLDRDELLCSAQTENISSSVYRGYLSAVLAKLQDTAQDKPETSLGP